MKSLRLLSLLLVACLPFFSGCQTWSRGGDQTTSAGVRLRTPPGWIYHPNAGGTFLATQDGIFLQRFTITRQKLSVPLAHNKRTLSASLTPFELAEAVIDDLKANRTLHRLAVVENTPAKFGGRNAVRLVVDYYLEDDTHVTSARYVCTRGDYLYVATLEAPARHYFAAALPAFEDAVRSATFTE